MKNRKYLPLIFLMFVLPFATQAQVVSDVYTLNQQKPGSETQVISLDLKLQEIESLFGIHIFYKSDEVSDTYVNPISYEADDAGQFLMKLLEPLNMSYRKITDDSFVVFKKEIIEPEPLAQPAVQEETVTGTVLDQSTMEALPGVNIAVKGSQTGTSSDADGFFELLVPSLTDTLIFSYIGYGQVEIPIEGRSEITVELVPQVFTGEEIIVVGYGEQRRGTLTGSVTSVNFSERSEGQPLTNASQALYGVSGLNVRLDNSYPGTARTRINLRGVGTLSGNREPLVLVDGIRYSMDELNPNDIESITVLKDASAAIYGSRGANGVILVTTKQGGRGAQINYNNYIGIQKPTYLPDIITDAMEYFELKNLAVMNAGATLPEYSAADIAAYQQGMIDDPLGHPNNNWFDIALRDGFIQKHDFSISGGDDNYRYRLSLGYLDQQGFIVGPNNDAEEYSIGVNTIAQVTSRLEVGLTLHGNYRWYTRPSYNSGGNTDYMGRLMRALPIMPDLLEDGSYGQPWIRVPGRNNWEHPRQLAEEGYLRKNVQRFLTSISARYELPLNMTYNMKFGVDKYDGHLEYFIPRMQKTTAVTGQIQFWNSEAASPRAFNEDDNDLNIDFHHTLNWREQFGGVHDISVMAGTSYENSETIRFSAQARGYFDGTLTALDAGSVPFAVGGRTTRDVLQSYFGRVNYNFDEKYLLEAVFRYDGSSRFAPGNRWGFFPSVSAGWRIDMEPFFPDLNNFVNLMKLRASIGETGNQAVPLYSYENIINLGNAYNYTLGGSLVPGAGASSYADPNISWETTTTYNAGLDVNLWDNRINATLDVYQRITRDILRPVSLPSQVGGLGGPQQNIGEVQNSGYEISAAYNNSVGNFSYQIRGNFNYNKNEVTDLDGEIIYNHGTNLPTITKEGYAMNSMYLLKSDGIFRNQAEVDAHVNANGEPLQPNAKPGWIRFVDVNGDGRINGDDRVIVENSSIMPKYTFGFDINLGYKGFALDATFQGIAGIRYFTAGNIAFPFNNGANATREWVTDAWTPDNPDARLPIVMPSTGRQDNFQNSDFWLRDGSYLRLRNIQLSYSLPPRWLNQVGIQRLTVFVNAQNWLTFTRDNHHIDPETATDKISIHHYPMMRTATTGLNVTF